MIKTWKNKKQGTLLVMLLMLIPMFQGCLSQPEADDIYQPEHAGAPNEIYVFCENDIWKDTIGSFLQAELEYRMENMPQAEKRFTLFQFEPKAMTKARRTHRNIIEIEINDRTENSETRLVKKHDSWAKDQLRYEFKGQQMGKVLALIKAEMPALIQEISNKEILRFQDRFMESKNGIAERKLKEERGISLKVPNKLILRENRENFVWMEARGLGPEGKRVLHQGVFVYHYPYSDDSTFTYKYLLNKRNEILKANVIGATNDQYLTTLMLDGKQPTMEVVNYNDEYAVEIRGQFTMHNGYMGGPFVSLTTLDKANNQIVTVEGYCYAPLLEKRDYLKEMEAVVYSLGFTDKKESSN